MDNFFSARVGCWIPKVKEVSQESMEVKDCLGGFLSQRMNRVTTNAKSFEDAEQLKAIPQTIVIDGNTLAEANVNVYKAIDDEFLSTCCITTGTVIQVHTNALLPKLIRLDVYGTPHSIQCAFELIVGRLLAAIEIEANTATNDRQMKPADRVQTTKPRVKFSTSLLHMKGSPASSTSSSGPKFSAWF